MIYRITIAILAFMSGRLNSSSASYQRRATVLRREATSLQEQANEAIIDCRKCEALARNLSELTEYK